MRDIQNRTEFFVELEDCITCGCCQAEAPNNFSWSEPFDSKNDETGEILKGLESSQVHKQPATEEELAAVITAFNQCMTEAIQYGGNNPQIAKQLINSELSATAATKETMARPRRKWFGLYWFKT